MAVLSPGTPEGQPTELPRQPDRRLGDLAASGPVATAVCAAPPAVRPQHLQLGPSPPHLQHRGRAQGHAPLPELGSLTPAPPQHGAGGPRGGGYLSFRGEWISVGPKQRFTNIQCVIVVVERTSVGQQPRTTIILHVNFCYDQRLLLS